MPRKTLAEMIFCAFKNYNIYLKSHNKKINEHRKNNIKELTKLCNSWSDEHVLYNKIKYYLKEHLKHKRMAWSLFIVQVDHSEFRLMLNSALEKWEAQQKTADVNANLLEQNKFLIAKIEQMEENFAKIQKQLSDKENLVKDLVAEIKLLKSDDSLRRINYDLHRQVCTLQQQLLRYEAPNMQPMNSINYDLKSICS